MAEGSAAGAEEVEQSVFLMRHGVRQDTAFPSWRKTANRPYDTPLSIRGHNQAAQLTTQRLKGKDIEVVISSPFLRCIQTATHAYQALELPGLHTYNQLCEWLAHYNHMRETPNVPALQDAKKTVFLSVDSEPLPKFPESRAECHARYRQALDTIADRHWPHNLLLVTHQDCVQEAVKWGGENRDVEAVYCAHVQLSRHSKDSHNWTFREEQGIFTYDSVIMQV